MVVAPSIVTSLSLMRYVFINVHFIIDACVSVFAGFASVSIFQSPLVTFEGVLLALVIMLLAVLLLIASIVTLPIMTKYMLFLERFPGRGSLVLLIGVVCYGGVPWRIFLALVTICVG